MVPDHQTRQDNLDGETAQLGIEPSSPSLMTHFHGAYHPKQPLRFLGATICFDTRP